MSQRLAATDYAQRIAGLLLPALAQHRPDASNAQDYPQPGLLALLGSELAEDVMAPLPHPLFDNSQMDGIAVNSADVANLLRQGPASLPVSRTIAAGAAPGVLEPETAVAIMTGAAIPDGADAIIPIEDCTPNSFADGVPEHITIHAAPEPGTFIRRAGSDQRAGEVLFRAGDVLNARRLGVAAALGMSEEDVPVTNHVAVLPVTGPKVLILSTGSELVQPGTLPKGEAPELGKIFDANTTMLAAVFADYGLTPVIAETMVDDPGSFLTNVTTLLHEHSPSFVVSSGGVSAGAFEVVKVALEAPGIEFHKVAMQPGGPQGSGALQLQAAPEVPFIALPGNPVSAWISVEAFIRPALVQAGVMDRTGHILQPRQEHKATLSLDRESETSPRDLWQLRRANFDGSGQVTLEAGPSSHLLAALANANAILPVPVGVDTIHSGATMTIWTLENG